MVDTKPGKSMKYLIIASALLTLVGCQSLNSKDERMAVSGHLNEPVPEKPAVEQDIPPVVDQLPIVAAPKPAEKLQTFTVVATNLPASELLFALARDARLNLDIDPAIEGNVSINAIDQTLPQILKRISRQVSLRYYLDGPNLVVEQNLPFMRVYHVDYLNIERTTDSTVSIATQIATTGTVEGGGGGGGSNSSTDISNKSVNDFWKSLEDNLGKMAEGDVISNREGGTISVMATANTHEMIQEFMDRVLSNARKQVLIEATVVEVTLNDEFQAGVDWASITSGDGWDVTQSTLAGALGTAPFTSATYSDTSGS
jgi:general secretion pathway protein D